jgi:hypothetical protein
MSQRKNISDLDAGQMAIDVPLQQRSLSDPRNPIMTSEMTFQCLLVSHDPAVLGTMDPILQNFSMCTSVCVDPSRFGALLGEGGTDLVVIDLETDDFSQLLQRIQDFPGWQKPTILALSGTDRSMPGVHVTLRKPVTPDSGVRSVKVAYSRMMQDFRKHTRFALMTPVTATDENDRELSLTVTNIGEGGVGITTKESVGIGSTLLFRLRLPDLTHEITIRSRILWTRGYGVGGCEFVNIPDFDLQLLHAWLESRYRIKKPLICI